MTKEEDKALWSPSVQRRWKESMDEFIQKAATLIEALPYIREFEGKTVVIKYGGAATENRHLRRSTMEDITLMRYVGMNPVIVHGGGPEISCMLKQLEVDTHFHNGLRVTSDEAIDVVEMVLAGSVNKAIVNLINCAGGNAVGLCGKDGNLLHARKIELDDGPWSWRATVTGPSIRRLSWTFQLPAGSNVDISSGLLAALQSPTG